MEPDTRAGLPSVRVLILDDEEPIRRLVQSLLTQHGCQVEVADSGRAGLHILLQRDFDVAVIDLRMPDLGGSDFLRQARSIWPWLGIIILSGHADQEAKANAQRYGVTRVLSKPVQLKVLLESVLAEAAEKKRRGEMSASLSMDHLQDQLALLRHFSEQAIAADNLEEAMRSLSVGLARLLPCEAVAILNLQADEQALYLNTIQPVAQSFVLAMEQEILLRYELLGTQPHPRDSLRVLFDPARCYEAGPTTVGSSFSVPIISGGEVRGLLTLSAASPLAFGSVHAAFMYHAANQLGTVLTALARMRQLAVRDTLTGLYNRKGLLEELQRVWSMARRYNWSVGVAILDLDDFKGLNDTHGHLRGDDLLREFARVVSRVTRESDIIARFGGDELVVILPQAGESDCLAFGERLLQAMHKHLFGEKELGGIQLTASVGLASSRNNPCETSAQLLAQADAALYAAKRQGRHRVCIHRHANGPTKDETPGEPSTALPVTPAPSSEAKRRGTVLVVDDDPAIGLLLSRMLAKQDLAVQVELNAGRAWQAIVDRPGHFDVLLTDLNLPDASGLELLDKVRPIAADMIKIVITGQATLDNAVMCLRRGAYDFIEKPVTSDHLYATLDRALEYRRLKLENQRYQNQLEDMVREKSTALREALIQVKTSYDFTLEAMASLLDVREKSTARHSSRVRDLSVILAREMGLPQGEIEDLARGALLHDIGKMCIPDSILLKPGAFTEDERKVMNTHPEVGYQMLSSSTYLQQVAELVYSHHERFDGKGYPRGLQGGQIALGARIFAVVDAYDAMRSDRIYRASQPALEALEEIKRHAGQQFDPQVVEAFLRCHLAIEAAGKW